MPAINILGTFQDPNNLDQGAGKLVNVRVVPRDQQREGITGGQPSKPAAARFMGTPGLKQVCKPSSSPCITIGHALGTIWSAHADGSIYHGVETPNPILSGFVAVKTDSQGGAVVRFAEDRTALAISSNSNILNSELFGTAYTATPLGGVVNAGFDASIDFDPSAVAELDNITIWSAASNVYANQDAKMYRSQPLQPGNVDPNAFATKEARADRVVDLAISVRNLWPLGSRSIEQWYNSGANSDFPFVAYPNSLISVGLAARSSLAVLRDVIVFVGTDKRIWRCTGQSGQPVSPPWIDLLLQQLTEDQLSRLTAYAYGQGGSDFYNLTLPGAWTLELASTTGVWCYRQSAGRNDHAARCATEHDGGTTYVGLVTGEICTVDLNSETEPGGPLFREIITPWVGSEEARQTYNAIDVTSSMGTAAGLFQLDWSEDRAVTWRGLRDVAFPEPGQRRSIARNMGTGRRRQFRLRYSGSQAPFTIDELFANVTTGS